MVISHNNPDPDAIASAFALTRIVRDGTERVVEIGYSGMLGRAENRALVKALGEPIYQIEDTVRTYDGLVLVDCQPGTGNVSLPLDVPILGVIDHHPRLPVIRKIPFADVRTTFGSCTALLYEYWNERGLPLDKQIATILYYAVRSETQELGREASRQDRSLFKHLHGMVDWELLHRIVHAPVPRSYYVTFKVALERARLYGDVLFSDAGELPIPDAAAEIADWMLRLDEVKWALACGTYRGKLLFSLRSLVIGAHCGSISQQIVKNWGMAGGHGSMAGGQVLLGRKTPYDRNTAIIELERRYLRVMGKMDLAAIEDPFAIVPGGLSK